ncbi:MAG: UspA protein, partial [Klenkia sp.]|nr:UspA protein [Klenkia sp.]
EAAAHAAARTAQQLGAPLRLVRVVRLPSEDPVDERGSGVALQHAGSELDRLRAELAVLLPGLEVTAAVRRGRTADELIDESAEAERVVLGEHTGDRGLGAVADGLVMHAHAPVLLHRGGDRPGGSVVVGLDCLPGTEVLLRVAADEACLRGALLHVVHGRMSRGSSHGMLTAEQRLLERLVDRVRGERPHLRVHVEARAANATTLLLEAARDAQVLVIGRRVRGARRPTSGTGSAALLRAPCPVLVVPGDDALRQARTTAEARELAGR